MTKRELAAQLSEQIKKNRTQTVVLESANELYRAANGNIAIVNEVVGYMEDDLEGVYVVSEQFENRAQLSAMAYLHSIINQAAGKAKDTQNNPKT